MSILSVLTLFNIYFVYTNNIFYNPNITLSLSFLLIPLLGEYIISDKPYIPAMMFFPLLALMGQAHFAVYYGIVPTVIVYLIIRYKYTIKNICIDDFDIKYCKGCRNCHKTGKCIIQYDDVPEVMKQYNWADIIISVSPSYWADIPGQFKVFIDRCTPWCNTHDPHASIGIGKRDIQLL